MNKKLPFKIKITDRDLKILHHISTYGFSSCNELFKFFDSKKINKVHNRRLNMLKKSDLIYSLKSDFSERPIGYSLTSQGHELLKKNGFSNPSFALRKDKYRGKYRHSVLLKKVQSILLTSSIVGDYIPEHQVAKWLKRSDTEVFKANDKLPDGLFSLDLKTGKEKVALELELNLKSQSRYEDIFRRHLTATEWTTVFYIVKDDKMSKQLRAFIEQVTDKVALFSDLESKNNIYICTLDEFLKERLKALFKDKDLSFCLKSLERQKCPLPAH